MFTGSFLAEVKRKALRRGTWFKTLDRVERGILSLTANIVDRVESVILGVELVKIVSKLRRALKSEFVRKMEEYGFTKARVLAKQAAGWNNRVARKWASDLGFVRYVTFLYMNKPLGWEECVF